MIIAQSTQSSIVLVATDFLDRGDILGSARQFFNVQPFHSVLNSAEDRHAIQEGEQEDRFFRTNPNPDKNAPSFDTKELEWPLCSMLECRKCGLYYDVESQGPDNQCKQLFLGLRTETFEHLDLPLD